MSSSTFYLWRKKEPSQASSRLSRTQDIFMAGRWLWVLPVNEPQSRDGLAGKELVKITALMIRNQRNTFCLCFVRCCSASFRLLEAPRFLIICSETDTTHAHSHHPPVGTSWQIHLAHRHQPKEGDVTIATIWRWLGIVAIAMATAEQTSGQCQSQTCSGRLCMWRPNLCNGPLPQNRTSNQFYVCSVIQASVELLLSECKKKIISFGRWT